MFVGIEDGSWVERAGMCKFIHIWKRNLSSDNDDGITMAKEVCVLRGRQKRRRDHGRKGGVLGEKF